MSVYAHLLCGRVQTSRRWRLQSVVTCLMTLAVAGHITAAEKLNVLFIAVDDLRPELGCYGVETIKSPNIDRLAAAGTTFTRAYCQQAVCSPSRTSLLLGRRPDTTKIYDLQTHFRLHLPDVVTMPQYFKQNGYHTAAMGKIYHGNLDDPQSWSVETHRPQNSGYHDPNILAAIQAEQKKLGSSKNKVLKRDPKTGVPLKVARPKQRARGPAFEAADVADNGLADGMVADEAVKRLKAYKQQPDTPFFLAVGFYKPHLPFVAPKKYFDLYPREQIKLADNPFAPANHVEIAMTTWGELRGYKGMPADGPVADEQARDLRQAYYACVSYTDAQIGRVIDALDELGLRDKTVIVLWGDHGWQLGEHGMWCKHTNFEIATHAPMIFSAPGQKQPGSKTASLSEFVDIYPTLCDLVGLPLPEGLEGTTLTPVMNDPDRIVKSAAFSQYPREGGMGHSMRTDRYRYTEWRQSDGKLVGTELYDHNNDPAENKNIANEPVNKDLIARLGNQLKAGWQAARVK